MSRITSPVSNSKIGGGIESAAVLEVASRLLSEGLSRLDEGPEAALVALRQSFALERQFGDDANGERLCRACAGLSRALAKAAHPSPPAEAVTVLLQALDTLEARRRKASGGGPSSAASGFAAPSLVLRRADDAAANDFLSRELLGLARRLAGNIPSSADSPPPSRGHSPNAKGGSASGGGGVGGCSLYSAAAAHALAVAPPRLDELRAADRAFERLAQMAARDGPLRLATAGPHGASASSSGDGGGGGGGSAAELVLTHQEILFQLAQTARQIGTTLLRENTSRDTEAATFYYSRAVRKLRLAGIADRDPHMRSLLTLVDEADAQSERLKNAKLSLEERSDPTVAPAQAAPVATGDDYCALM